MSTAWIWVEQSEYELRVHMGGDGAQWFRRQMRIVGIRIRGSRHTVYAVMPDNEFNRAMLERLALRCMKLDLKGGYFMDVTTLDFETYFSVSFSLTKMSTAEYVFSPEFETVGVGVRTADGKYEYYDDAGFRAALATGLADQICNGALLAHHAQFDGLILAHRYGICPGFWLDTLSMSSPKHGTSVGGSLRKLTAIYELGEKGDAAMKYRGRHSHEFTAGERSEMRAYCLNDVKLTWDLFKCLSEGFPERELAVIDQTIRMFTEPIVCIDEARMVAYHQHEVDRKRELLDRLGQDRSVIMSNDKFAGLLQSLGVDPPRKFSEKKARMDWAFAKKDPGFEALKQHDDPMVRTAVEVRLGVKSTINETRCARFLSIGRNRRPMPVYLKYAGAHTHRWSGGDKMNWQNLERVDESNPNKGVIRQCILAPEGYKIVAVDSGQIEARVTAWIAEQEDLLDGFRRGEDVYCKFASSVYRRDITEKDKKERGVGKVCILGLGYSMGWAKLTSEMLKGPMGAQPIRFTDEDAMAMGVRPADFVSRKLGGNASDLRDKVISSMELEPLVTHAAVCEYLVRMYRSTNSRITQFWWNVCPEIIGAMLEGLEIGLGPITTGKNLIRLPSGLALSYPDLRMEPEHATYFNGRTRVSLHGGLVTENLGQALSRVVISDQLLDVARLGHKIVTTTHDEIVLCVPEAKAEQALNDLTLIMKTPPSWAAGLPLAAKGGFADSYGDAK